MRLSQIQPRHWDPGAGWIAWLAAVAPLAEQGIAIRDCKQPKGEEPCCRAGWLK